MPGSTRHLLIASLLLLSVLMIYVFHFFLLKEKSGAKKFKANPNRSARFATHAQQHSTSFCIILLLLLSSISSYSF
jgi:hypothetical protein